MLCAQAERGERTKLDLVISDLRAQLEKKCAELEEAEEKIDEMEKLLPQFAALSKQVSELSASQMGMKRDLEAQFAQMEAELRP